MESRLEPHIQTVEQELGVEAIAVWETGSNAYNFAHEDSDTDLTIVYVQPRGAYIIDRDYRKGFSDSTADIPLPEEIEIEGWDIKRFRELLLDSDPMVYEALNSPLAYKLPEPMEELAEYATERVHNIRLFKNYQSSAQGVFKSQREGPESISNKYMFHTVRNVLMARYIQLEHHFPPLDFEEFLSIAPDGVFVEFDRATVRELYHAKQDPDRAGDIIEPINREQMEEFFEFELKYEEHIPEETMDAEVVDEYLREVMRFSEVR